MVLSVMVRGWVMAVMFARCPAYPGTAGYG